MVNFVHQITSGMAGWLTFEHMRNGVNNLREAELAKPIELIAGGRGLEVKGEFPLPTVCGNRGAPPRVDFILVNRKQKLVVALEVKYKRIGRKMAGSLSSDAARLDDLSLDTINAQIEAEKGGPIRQRVDGFALERAVLVVWRQSAIVSQLKFEKKPIYRQFIRLMKAMLPAGVEPNEHHYSQAMLGVIATKPVARTYGSLRAGSTITYKRFWVATFSHQPAWKKIPRN
jgi:hypothetical protein